MNDIISYNCVFQNVFDGKATITLNSKNGKAAQIKRQEETSGTLHTTEVIKKGSLFKLQILIHRNAREDLKAVQNALERGVVDEGYEELDKRKL